MNNTNQLKQQRQASIDATSNGIPARTSNQFFGVGPITDMALDDCHGRMQRFAFDTWVENKYPKLNDKGEKIGNFTTAEFSRSMHRGYPADKVLLDMMQTIHNYFEFPKSNKMAVGLGGGHSGFTVCAVHLVNTNNLHQKIFIDTPRPETDAGDGSGFFRQSWGTQLLELQRYATNGDESRVHFSEQEGRIPSCEQLEAMGIHLFFGVGHETTGATTYSEDDIKQLLDWLDADKDNRHAVIDATSLLGAMPWGEDTIRRLFDSCCLFTPFQKAIGGVSGYFLISLTPQAQTLIDSNMQDPSWAIPRQLKIAVPSNPKRPFSSEITTALGPIYDPEKNMMLGGIINTYSVLAFAETTFGLLQVKETVGDVKEVNRRSASNRKLVNDWIQKQTLFSLGVEDPMLRGSAVTLLRAVDGDITDPDVHAAIIAKSKQLLGYEGLTHANGDFEPGLDVARYVNAFPGTPGDYRAWIGGIRPAGDVTALLDNLHYAYHRAKIVVLEEMLAKDNVTFPSSVSDCSSSNKPEGIFKVLIADLVGLRFDASGSPDSSEVQSYIENRGGVFHNTAWHEGIQLQDNAIHFFYQPELSTEEDLLVQTDKGQYDAVIAAATFLPASSIFNAGGVRIGAGTGNMGSNSWGGGNGEGGVAPLMNTPSFNSRATAHMVIKALLKVIPDVPIDELHQRVVDNNFDTGKNLREYPTEKLEGKRIAVLGYGNIGREVARLASGFGMDVVIYARAQHQAWIESEGFTYAATAEQAAHSADVLSPHTGLGALDVASATFSNAGLVNAAVLNTLADGAVLINYDRGEVVDAEALDAALASGKVRYAAIDADVFQKNGGDIFGPMQPYLAVEKKHRGKMELLPHAAADTEHVSRVEGAQQAVDQIIDAIINKKITNLKGDLPQGYSNAGACTVKGVGKVTGSNISAAAGDASTLAQLRQHSEQMAAFWGAVQAMKDTDRRQELIDRYATEVVRAGNNYRSLADKFGLNGPYS